MKKSQTDFIYYLGIGVFAFLSILEFCDIIEFISQKLLIINKVDSSIAIWLPAVFSIIIYTILLVSLVHKFDVLHEFDARKVLIKIIGIFFGIIVITLLVTYYGIEYLTDKFNSEFDSFYDNYKENYEIIAYTKFSIFLKYLILGAILLTKRKTVANNGYN